MRNEFELPVTPLCPDFDKPDPVIWEPSSHPTLKVLIDAAADGAEALTHNVSFGNQIQSTGIEKGFATARIRTERTLNPERCPRRGYAIMEYLRLCGVVALGGSVRQDLTQGYLPLVPPLGQWGVSAIPSTRERP
jgi:hypothetical protein